MECRVLESKNCRITSDYGKRGNSFHHGVDIVKYYSELDYIVAHSDGKVIECRDGLGNMKGSGSYGNYVKIDHGNGYCTLYAHMEKGLKVSKSQTVKKGQRIGYMGNSGDSNGGHLHFELWENGSRINPTDYLNKDLPTNNKNVNVYYRVKTQKHGWLPEVKNLEDYAGWENSPVTDVAIKVDKGSIKYRVHIKGKGWLPYVTGYNVKDVNNGYAGDGRIIDAIEVYYYTPNDIRPYKRAKYKVNNYSWQYDNEKTKGQDGYAGLFGVNVTKFQITIE